MKTAFSFAAVLTLLAAPAFAADNSVPQSTLSAIGLTEMDVMTDAQGNEVRGMSSHAKAMGLSVVTGLIVDPTTKSFVFGADVNFAKAGSDNSGKAIPSVARTAQLSSLGLALDIERAGVHNPGFTGTLVGGAGGSAMARAR